MSFESSANQNIFSFDTERTRLIEPHLFGHWAVGAVVMRPDRTVVEEFTGMIDPSSLRVSDFVEREIVPYVHLPEYKSSKDMLNAFWDFWTDHGGNDRVTAVADFGAVLEGTFFASAQALDLDKREFAGPYPLHELGTRLLDVGVDPDIDRIAFANQGTDFIKHDPRDDAVVAAHCWLKAGDILHSMRQGQVSH